MPKSWNNNILSNFRNLNFVIISKFLYIFFIIVVVVSVVGTMAID